MPADTPRFTSFFCLLRFMTFLGAFHVLLHKQHNICTHIPARRPSFSKALSVLVLRTYEFEMRLKDFLAITLANRTLHAACVMMGTA